MTGLAEVSILFYCSPPQANIKVVENKNAGVV
jgi:hypothetical protein